jgi:FG-GAP repeat
MRGATSCPRGFDRLRRHGGRDVGRHDRHRVGGTAALVFVKPPRGWTDATETARLPSPCCPYSQFASSVGISGDTVVVGAPATQAENADNAKGAVYVFVKPAGGWASEPYTAVLSAPDAQQRDNLGTSVAISGNTIVAGAPQAPYHPFETPSRNGKAYAFVSSNGGWTTGTQITKLTASDGAPGDVFGSFVGVSGGSIVVGAPGADVSGNTNQGAAYAFGDVSARIVLTKQLAPGSDAGRCDLQVGGTVVKTGAGHGGFGSLEVLPGTYRVSESAVAGTSLASYASSIACTLNGIPGPGASGTTQLDVTVAKDDLLACTITNKRKPQIVLTKHLVPSSDPGRFDLKIGGTLVRAGAGEGGTGSRLVGPGTYALSEVAEAGTSLSDYTSSIACTRNGGPGPSGTGASLTVSVDWGDALDCTITNRLAATITLRKDLRPSSDPGRFDLKVAGTVVKASAGNGGSGTIQVRAGTYRIS